METKAKPDVEEAVAMLGGGILVASLCMLMILIVSIFVNISLLVAFLLVWLTGGLGGMVFLAALNRKRARQ